MFIVDVKNVFDKRMKCPKCHYALSPFEIICPRCINFANLGIDNTVLSLPEQTVESSSNISDASFDVSQTDQPWYSKLDLDDNNPVAEIVTEPDKIEPAYASHIESLQGLINTKVVTISEPSGSPVTKIVDSQRMIAGRTPVYPPSNIVPRSKNRKRFNIFPFILLGSLLTMGVVLIVARNKYTLYIRHTRAIQVIKQADNILIQANASAAHFQQVELDPQQSIESFQLRTYHFQEAMRLCKAIQMLGYEQQVTGLEQDAGLGLRQVQADKEAQYARLLNASVATSITHYKRQVLTNEEAAQIRTTLQTECQTALTHVSTSLQYDPANAVALSQRVRTMRYMGDSVPAKVSLAHAILLCPNNPILSAEARIQK